MGLFEDILAVLDQKRRVARRNLSDLVSSPRQYFGMLNDRAANYNRNVTPVAQGGSLTNRPMTQSEIDDKYVQLGMDVMPGGVGMVAWHGSPHKFDKFDLSKIGTGEGAQAYGHGLYLAEAPDVAQTYKQSADWRQKTMDQMKYLVDGAEVSPKGVDDGLLYHYRMSAPDLFDQRIAHLEQQKKGSLDQAQYYAEQAKLGEDADRYTRMAERSHQTAKRFDEELQLAAKLRNQKVEAATGHLYKTDIPDEAVARFLDWDKPLSQQAPEVQDILYAKGMDKIKPGARLTMSGDAYSSIGEPTGADIYNRLSEIYGSVGGNGSVKSTEMFGNLGIPGIRYLDGGSRSAGKGSSNFVIFDPEMIRILERNGISTGRMPWKPGEWQGMLSGGM
jgi:TfoX/Sxy family transcriptional regulator of competence genes